MTIHHSPDDASSGSKDRAPEPGSGFGAGLSTPASSDSSSSPPSRSRSRKSSTKSSRSTSRKRSTSKASGDAPDSEGRAKADSADERPAKARRSRSSTRKSSGRKSSVETDSEGATARGSKASEDEERPKRTRRSRSSKSSSKRTREATQDAEPEEEKSPKTRKSRAKRSSTTARNRKSSKSAEEPIVGFLPDEGDEMPTKKGRDAKKSTAKKRKTRSRRKSSEQEEDEREEEEAPRSRSRKARTSKAKKASKKRTRRSSKRSRSSDGDREDDEPEESKPKRKRKASKKKSKAAKTPEELAAEAEALRTKTILVNATDPEERRVVLVEGEGRIEDLLMTAESQKNLVNDIYRGKVVNLEPAIGAAFVDFGQGRNGFLHTSDVMPVYGEDGFTLDKLLTTKLDEEDADLDLDDPDLDDDLDGDDGAEDEDDRPRRGRGRSRKKKGKKKAKASKSASRRSKASMQRRTRQRLPITDLLKVGDQVVVQITKDAIGDKGPTLTTYISIPGRYLVLMPSMARTGVSRKIPDENERRRLKRILAQLDAPEEMGVIVRTAGVGKLKTDLKRDLSYLLGVWKTFERKLKSGRGPTPLYQESDVATRTLRDLFNKETKEVIVDDFAVHEQMMEFAERLMPEHSHRIERYEGQRPIFHHYGIEQDFEVIFNRRVELPSGGSIVFDQAEALVAIDVNSGRTRTGSHDFEEIALKTNLEAVPEIALQIRLRDLGGIIVCDFIDMMKSSSNRAVEKALRAELAKDRARSKIGRIGQFGLLEMTRQRLGPGTHKKVFQACPRCRGTGRIRTVQSRAQAILRRLGSALTQKGFSTVEVRAHPEVVQYIKDKLWDYVRALEHRFERELRWTEVPDQPEDSVLRYLRADGREVRPGGRRKR